MQDAKLKELALALADATLALEKEKLRSPAFSTEPIAIVGVACRFPNGADDVDQFWNLLVEKKEGITAVPADRLSMKNYGSNGGFLKNPIADFDPKFFNISPREAEFLDPQQRLLLEVVYEAGIKDLKNSRTGVFVGISTNDYAMLIQKQGDMNPYVGTGTSHSTAAGRISYVFGLEGPCLSVDTACSSSLTALHLACLSLQNNECDAAIVAGVNILLSPEVTLNFSEAKMLAKDSHCKTFDAAADGYVRSEGCGVVILKKLKNPQENTLGIIRASGINQDGASGGLTVPNGSAQEALLSDVLSNAKLSPDNIDYIEAHGTGTSLGDPIEISAIKKVYKNNLTIGAVKSNIGHLEAAAGMAGLIKILLMFQHKKIPPNLYFTHPNPLIDFSTIKIPTEVIDWENKFAGLSSFGFSGTNAHVILERPDNLKKIIVTHPAYNKKAYWISNKNNMMNPTTDKESFLREAISMVLKIDPAELNPEQSLWELGMDSLMALQLKNILAEHFENTLDNTVFFNYPTLRALSDYLTKPLSIKNYAQTKGFSDIESFPEYQQLKLREKQFVSIMGRNCYFTVNDGTSSHTTLIDRREFINYSGYNYLGLSGDKRVIQAAIDAMNRYGTSVSASRLASGEKPLHEDLEHEIANFLGAESSLVFTTGHTTNVATITALMRPNDLILCDTLSHNSILMGATFSGATTKLFPHNNFSIAEKILQESRHKYERVLIIIEGVYSMDGDIPDINYAIKLKKQFDALLMIDEAHSLGIIGKTGKGIVEYGEVNPKDIDILMGTLSKSLASCGGYIAGKKALIDYLKYSSGSFVYSVGITPQNAAAALMALKILEKETWRVKKLQENAAYFLKQAKTAGLNTGNSKDSAVIPIIIGDSKKCLALSTHLYQEGINALPITYPAVEEAAARFRFFITSEHTQEEMDETIEKLI